MCHFQGSVEIFLGVRYGMRELNPSFMKRHVLVARFAIACRDVGGRASIGGM
jgi:hypothetical protein